jgi:hypothetical protein
MFDAIFSLLILLQIKHWYIDFVNQSEEEVTWKGTYLDWRGVKHSLKHGLATTACLLIVTGVEYLPFCIVLGFVDFLVHYHVDWSKMNLNKKLGYTIAMPQFWALLGLDQLAHQLTYIGIAWAMI